MPLIKRKDAIDFIKSEANRGKEMKIRFVKKDGTIRNMRAKYGFDENDYIRVNNPMNKGLEFNKLGLVSVFDLDDKQPKCFKEDTLISFQVDNQLYEVEESRIVNANSDLVLNI